MSGVESETGSTVTVPRLSFRFYLHFTIQVSSYRGSSCILTLALHLTLKSSDPSMALALPTEIVSAILKEAPHTAADRRQFAVRAASVCFQWRMSALDTPSLCSGLHIRLPGDFADYAQTFIERSRALPLDIVIDVQPDYLFEVTSVYKIFNCADRVFSLTLRLLGNRNSCRPFLYTLLKQPFSALHTLDIDLRSPTTEYYLGAALAREMYSIVKPRLPYLSLSLVKILDIHYTASLRRRNDDAYGGDFDLSLSKCEMPLISEHWLEGRHLIQILCFLHLHYMVGPFADELQVFEGIWKVKSHEYTLVLSLCAPVEWWYEWCAPQEYPSLERLCLQGDGEQLCACFESLIASAKYWPTVTALDLRRVVDAALGELGIRLLVFLEARRSRGHRPLALELPPSLQYLRREPKFRELASEQ